MVYLNLNSLNTFTLVCSDMVTIDNPIYLFRFEHEQTDEDFFIELPDLIPDNPRGSRFQIDLPTDIDLDNGYYRTSIFQSELEGDRDYENMLQLYSGRTEVIKEFATDTIYQANNPDDIVYNYGESDS